MGGAVGAEHSPGGEAHDGHPVGDAQFSLPVPQEPDGPLHIGHGIQTAVGAQAVGEDGGVEAGIGKPFGDVHTLTAGAGFKAAAVGHNHGSDTSGHTLGGHKNHRGLGLQRVPVIVARSALLPEGDLLKTGNGIVPDAKIPLHIHGSVAFAVLGYMADYGLLGADLRQNGVIVLVHRCLLVGNRADFSYRHLTSGRGCGHLFFHGFFLFL